MKIALYAIGLMIVLALAAAANVSYTYDAAGHLTQIVYGNGSVITYTYDNAGNLITRSVATTLTAQTITFGALSNQPYGTAAFPVSATASSGLTVSFASTTATVCTVSGSTVTLVAVGTCTIQATQTGTANYGAATPVNQSFQVTKEIQNITFGMLSNQTLESSPPPLSATASSGLGVTFSSNTLPVCTVSGVNITLAAVGICSITASQNGNATYNAATPVTQTFTVSTTGIQPVAGFLNQQGAPTLSFNLSTNFPGAGGFLIGAPGVTQDLNGNVYVVGLDDAGGVHLNSYSYANSTWNGWQYSGGILDTSSGLTAAVDPSGVVWFTGRDIGNRFWINSWNGTTFGGWILVADGIFASDSVPQIAIPSDGTIYVIGKDIGGRVWSDSYNPTNQTFTGWVDRQAVMIGQPSATAGQDGMVYVAVRSVASESPVYITQIPAQNAATANTWLNGGGEIDTDPQIASQGGTVYLLSEADGDTVYLLTFAESNQMFGTWNFTNGILNDSTIAAAGGNVFIAGRDSLDRIYWYSLTGNNWVFAGGAGISSTVLAGGK
jgi:YD repeat-containing protein